MDEKNDGQIADLRNNPEYWKAAWQKAKEHSPVNRRYRGETADEIADWNARAESYAGCVRDIEESDEFAWIIDWIATEGGLEKDSVVLDIGCGPGTFALPFAGKVSEVVALDPSENMLRLLEDSCRQRGLGNVRALHRSWDETNLEKEEFTGSFDLVFASMCPGVADPPSIDKMLQASRGLSYFSGWSGTRWGPWAEAQARLWPEIFGEELGSYPSDVLFPFGLLYAMGFRPGLRFRGWEKNREIEPEEATAGLMDHLSQYTEITPGVERIIRDYVEERTANGVFREHSVSQRGFMLWRV